jgi:hypothetical protein
MSSPTATAPPVSATGDPLLHVFPGLVIDHSQDRVSYQANIIACSVITWVAAAVFVAARFYTRRLLLQVWSWEDWIIVLSLMLSTMCSASVITRQYSPAGWEIAWLKDSQKQFWVWARIFGPFRLKTRSPWPWWVALDAECAQERKVTDGCILGRMV